MIIFSLGFTFSLASVSGKETGIDSLSVPGAVGVGPVRSSRGFTVSVSDSFCFCFRLNSLLYVSQMIYYGHKSISGSKLIIYIRFQNIFQSFIGYN